MYYMKKSNHMAWLTQHHFSIKSAWDEYGHAIPWEKLDGFAFSDHGYVVVRWTENGMVNMADLAWDGFDEWEMQNDQFEPITEEDWNKLILTPECDWFTIPGHKEHSGY